MTETTAADVPEIAAPGAFLYWPDNVFWSFQMLRLFAQSSAGAADLTECHLVAKDVEAGDVEAWYEGFHALAERVDAEAAAAEAEGDFVTARDAYKRACNYHRTAGFFLTTGDDRYLDAVAARRRSFQAAIPLDDMTIEPIDVPFEHAALPGYVISEPGTTPAATVIVFGGADSVCEELYFAIGRGLAERGFRAVVMDGPGQGEALKRGLHARANWEVPTAAVIDFLLQREDVDPGKLAFVGQSLGGLYAVRVAAHEPRLASVVAWGGQWDVQALFATRLEQGAGPVIDHYARWFPGILGVERLEEVAERLKPFRAAEDAAKVACPLLVMHGEADTVVPVEHARRLYDAIPRDDKELRIYRYGEAGCEHCQVDSIVVANRDIGAFLRRTLGA